MQFQKEWSEGTVIEPTGFVDDELNTVGAFTLQANTLSILSLSPGEDFELNTDIIHNWKVVFQASNGEVLGDADYFKVINTLTKHVLDQQNGSILIQKLTDDELHETLVQTIFD